MQLWRINKNTFRFRVFNKQFVGLDGINVVAVSNTSTHSETFDIVKESNNSSRIRIKASNGYFLQVINHLIYLFLPFLLVILAVVVVLVRNGGLNSNSTCYHHRIISYND